MFLVAAVGSKDVESGRQTLKDDFQDIVEAFKGLYKFYDSFAIKDDNDRPAAKNKPADKKNPKKKVKNQKVKKPKITEKPDGIDRIDIIEEPTEKPKKDNKIKNKNKNEKKKKNVKKQVAKEPEDEPTPGLNLTQLFRREMRKLWTQLQKYVTENLYSAFEE